MILKDYFMLNWIGLGSPRYNAFGFSNLNNSSSFDDDYDYNNCCVFCQIDHEKCFFLYTSVFFDTVGLNTECSFPLLFSLFLVLVKHTEMTLSEK